MDMWQHVTACDIMWQHVTTCDAKMYITTIECGKEGRIWRCNLNSYCILLWIRRTPRSIIKIRFTMKITIFSNAAYPSLHSYFVLKDCRNVRRIWSPQNSKMTRDWIENGGTDNRWRQKTASAKNIYPYTCDVTRSMHLIRSNVFRFNFIYLEIKMQFSFLFSSTFNLIYNVFPKLSFDFNFNLTICRIIISLLWTFLATNAIHGFNRYPEKERHSFFSLSIWPVI